MKKNKFLVPLNRNWKKLLLTMKLCLLFLLISATSLMAGSVYSQSTTLSIHLKNATLRDFIQDVEKQSEFIFFFYDEVVDLNRKIDIQANGQTIDKILDEIFESSELTYRIFDRQIGIGKRDPVTGVIELPKPLEELVAADKKLSGIVKDNKGDPIPGATIIVKGTTIGTTTDFGGKFMLNVPADVKILSISFVGYQTQEITIGNQIDFQIVLKEQTIGVEEVVIVGYGQQKKESVVGAISQIATQDIIQAGTANVSNAIAGKLSGVLTIQQSGRPGSSNAEIIVRGLSSWNGSQPLILVDGVERDFTELDPNEINSVSVLKDASATAVFGAKGANGVIIVTTRRGNEGKPKLNVSLSIGIDKPTRMPEHIDSYTTMSLLNVALMNGGSFQDLISGNVLAEYKNPSSPLNALRYPNVDWFDLLVKPFALSNQANINVSGGTSRVKYFSSLGYLHEGSIFDGYHEGNIDGRYRYDRFNYRTNLDFDFSESSKLSFNIGGDISITNTQGGVTGLSGSDSDIDWRSLYGLSPARFPAYYPAWVLAEVPDLNYPDANEDRLAAAVGEKFTNPYATFFNATFDKYLNSKLFSDIIFEQKLNFITKGLSFKGKASLSTSYINNILSGQWGVVSYSLDYDKIGTDQNPWIRQGEGNETYKTPPFNASVGGMAGSYYSNWYSELSLNYDNTLGRHNISALALVNWQQKNNGAEFPYYNAGIVGRITYNYMLKYLLEVNLGYTGSERFSPENRFGFFPSAAVGWVVSNEEFFKAALPWVNNLKLRYSDGFVGSDVAANRWLYISNYSLSGNIIREDKAPNSVARWEQSHKRDIGVDIGLFDNLFSFTLELFDERRTNMLLTPQTVTFLVGNTFKELNKGSMKKHGFEIEAQYNKKITNNFHYYLKGIFGFNENRIIARDDLPYAYEHRRQAGKPLGGTRDGMNLINSGYFTSIDDLHISPTPVAISGSNVGDYQYLDFLPDGKIDTYDLHPIKGSTYAPITYSMSGGVTYKGFEFNLLFQGNAGKYINYNHLWEFEFLKGAWKITKSQLDYWRPDNQDANHATLNYVAGDQLKYHWSGGDGEAVGYALRLEGRTWRKGNYLRLKDIYLGYSFETKKLRQMVGISNLHVYVNGNNLWTFTKLLEGDPERQNFQQGFYPIMTSLRLGLKVSF